MIPVAMLAARDLPKLDPATLHERRERVFLVLAGVFLGTLAMLNILGITRFLRFGSFELADHDFVFAVAVGVLPYPITFLCTDFICELYGRRRANFVVWIGLLLNIWVMLILWIGSILPGFESVDPTTGLPAADAAGRLPVFFEVKTLAFGAVAASMVAYLVAQFCDVYVFHFWKRMTKGRHLWLRNNGSTMISQLVDTMAVILITHFYAHALPISDEQPLWPQLLVYIFTGYAFKFTVAAFDTIPFYLGVHCLSRYLRIDPSAEHSADREEIILALPVPGERIE